MLAKHFVVKCKKIPGLKSLSKLINFIQARQQLLWLRLVLAQDLTALHVTEREWKEYEAAHEVGLSVHSGISSINEQYTQYSFSNDILQNYNCVLLPEKAIDLRML